MSEPVSVVPGTERWSYGAFEFDRDVDLRTVPLVRDDGKVTSFTVPEFVSEPRDLQEIARIVIAACERWENRQLTGERHNAEQPEHAATPPAPGRLPPPPHPRSSAETPTKRRRTSARRPSRTRRSSATGLPTKPIRPARRNPRSSSHGNDPRRPR